MANIIETVSGSQQNQTNSINHGFVAVQSAALFGIKGSDTEELTLTLYGGAFYGSSGLAFLDEQSVTLVDNATNYVEATLAGVVSANQSAFTSGRIKLYTFTIADGGGIDFDNYVDHRTYNLTGVGGPASSTDNALARWDGTDGRFVQNSVGTLSDTGALAGLTSLAIASGTITDSAPGISFSQTWNDGTEVFVGASFDFTITAASTSSSLFRWQVGGSPVAQVVPTGFVVGPTVLLGHGIAINLVSTSTGNATQRGINVGYSASAVATTAVQGVRSLMILQDGGGVTYASHVAFDAAGVTKSGGSDTLTENVMFRAANSTTGAVNYAFQGLMTVSGTARYNLYMSGTAPNYLEGYTGIGATPSSSTRLLLTAGVTGMSSLRIPHGVAPTSPVDGDMWSTTTTLNFRLNGVTKSITMT